MAHRWVQQQAVSKDSKRAAQWESSWVVVMDASMEWKMAASRVDCSVDGRASSRAVEMAFDWADETVAGRDYETAALMGRPWE